MSSSPDFQLFTSIRYDPLLLSSEENSRADLNFITPSPFYMLTYHRDRMVEAAQHFDFDPVTSKLADGPALHQELLHLIKDWQTKERKENGPLKVRILFDKAGNMTVDFLPIPAVPLTTLYPTSFDPPHDTQEEHPAKQQQKDQQPGALPAGDASQDPQPPQAKKFRPSPLTGGALSLGKDVSLPAGNQDPHHHPTNSTQEFKPSPLTGGALSLGQGVTLPAGNKDPNWLPTVDAATSGSPPNDSSSIPAPPEWKLKLDTSPTPSSPYTLLKTTQRDMYDASRSRALPQNPTSAVHREVILYNDVNEVTEGTLTSLYFWRGGKWVTPPVGVPEAFKIGASDGNSGKEEEDNNNNNSDEGELRKPFAGRWGHSVRSAKVGAGGQRGTSRRWALGKGFCMEEPIDVKTVQVGEGVWVSNGVRGFGYGRVVS